METKIFCPACGAYFLKNNEQFLHKSKKAYQLIRHWEKEGYFAFQEYPFLKSSVTDKIGLDPRYFTPLPDCSKLEMLKIDLDLKDNSVLWKDFFETHFTRHQPYLTRRLEKMNNGRCSIDMSFYCECEISRQPIPNDLFSPIGKLKINAPFLYERNIHIVRRPGSTRREGDGKPGCPILGSLVAYIADVIVVDIPTARIFKIIEIDVGHPTTPWKQNFYNDLGAVLEEDKHFPNYKIWRIQYFN